jgi:hypothetical protein
LFACPCSPPLGLPCPIGTAVVAFVRGVKFVEVSDRLCVRMIRRVDALKEVDGLFRVS